MASRTSRIEVRRGRPPGYTGIRGSTKAHCSSVRSLGYRCARIPTTYENHPYRTASESGSLCRTDEADPRRGGEPVVAWLLQRACAWLLQGIVGASAEPVDLCGSGRSGADE